MHAVYLTRLSRSLDLCGLSKEASGGLFGKYKNHACSSEYVHTLYDEKLQLENLCTEKTTN